MITSVEINNKILQESYLLNLGIDKLIDYVIIFQTVQ